MTHCAQRLGVPLSDIITGEAVVIDVPCARFPSRMVALFIDVVAQIALLITLGIIVAAAGADGRLDNASEAAIVLTVFVLAIVGYPTIFETLSRGRSLGKMALGLRVVSDDGGPERFRQALVRALASVVEIWSLFGCPALITSLISAKGKRLGDIFAGTFVIQERLPARTGQMAMMPPWLAAWAARLELSGLPDETAAMARGYLSRFWELTPAAREEFGRRIAADVASRVSPPPPPGTPPADYLSAVLAERRAREQARLSGWQPGYGQPAPWQGPPPAPPAPWQAPAPAPPAPWHAPSATPPPAPPENDDAPGQGTAHRPGGFVPPA